MLITRIARVLFSYTKPHSPNTLNPHSPTRAYFSSSSDMTHKKTFSNFQLVIFDELSGNQFLKCYLEFIIRN